MRKFLLIQPPITEYSSPHLAIPTLAGQLKKIGIKTQCIDYNIDFFWKIFDSKFIAKIIKKNDKLQNRILKKLNDIEKKEEDIKKKILISKLSAINNYKKNFPKKELKKLSVNTKKAINILKTNKFYNTKLYKKADRVIQLLTYAVSVQMAPFIYFKNNLRLSEPLEYLLLKYVIFDKENNIFWQYFMEKVKEIKKGNPQFIGISISAEEQILPGLTLAYLLKKETNAHINIGGIIFSKNIELIKKEKDFFDLFADSISCGEGEHSIIKLAKYIKNEINITDVPGLTYKKNNQIISNNLLESVDISKIALPDFSDFNLAKYLSPEIILPIETHRSCYWGKCVFCDINHSKTTSNKTIEQVINEIKNYKNNLGISHFAFVDSAMPPAYLKKLSQSIINNNLDIKFSCDARLEKGFDYETLKKAYNAGLRIIAWGYETANQRISNLMKKGIDVEHSLKILDISNKAGIWNTIYAIIGFPTETNEEAQNTIDTIISNKDIIQSAVISIFYLPKFSYITNNLEEFSIKKEYTNESFSNFINYSEKKGLSNKEKLSLRNYFLTHNSLFLSSKIHHCTFLNNVSFIFKYDLNTLKNMLTQ